MMNKAMTSEEVSKKYENDDFCHGSPQSHHLMPKLEESVSVTGLEDLSRMQVLG